MHGAVKKKKTTNLENRGCQRAVPLTGCLTRKELLFIWGIKVLGFSLEAHLENLWVEPYDAWDLLQNHVRVGVVHGQPRVCVQCLVLVMGASQSLLPDLACPSLTRPDAGRLIQQCHLWVRWSLCALLEHLLHEGRASSGTNASSTPGTENTSGGSSGTSARAWDFP